MPNCVKTEAQQTGTISDSKEYGSSIMQIQPVPVTHNQDNSNGMEQNIYSQDQHHHFGQQAVTEWTPMMHPIQMNNQNA